MDQAIWAALGDRNLRETVIQTSTGQREETKIRRYYDPATRDTKIELYRSEPSIIDSSLEIINATTDLVA